MPKSPLVRVLRTSALLGLVLALVAPLPAQAATPTVYQGHVYSSGATAPSADKPQSKLWHTDGSWWALMVNAAGTVNVFELVGHAWRDTGTVVDDRTASTGDALFSGGKLYVASRTAGTSGAVRVYQYSYSTTTRTYTRDRSPFVFGGGGTESATIDQDSTGRLWVSFTRGRTVLVAHTTDAARSRWSSPFRISGADTSVSADDISAVIAFDGKVGVLWSDQTSVAVRFAWRPDTAPTTSWTVETPLAGGALADDHLNIKSLQGDDQGRLYAAVKTSKTSAGDPSLLVLTRTAAGGWSTATTATVADNLTRPQIALDKTNRVLYVMQSTESGGSVYYKSSPLSDRPSFGPGTGAPFIAWSGARINNVSTTKDPVTATTGLVAIAADPVARRYYHAELSLAGAEPTPSPAPSPTPSTRQVVLNPVADTMVQQAAPTTASGSATVLVADTQDVSGTASAVHDYLRFQVPALAAGETVTAARLSLQVTGKTANGPAVWRTGTTWAEATTTWSSGRPARSGTAPVGNFGSMAVGRVSTPVAGVAGGGDVSFELAPESTDGLDLASREDPTSSRRPQLVLTVSMP